MKAPISKGPRPQPQQAPVPAAYLAMAAAHMQSMGKQVYQDQPPSTQQITSAVTNAPSN